VQAFGIPEGTERLTFSVHALPGAVTGDLLSAEILSQD
jgi:hypothetical protein